MKTIQSLSCLFKTDPFIVELVSCWILAICLLLNRSCGSLRANPVGGLVVGDLSHPTGALYCFFPVRVAPEGSMGPSWFSWGRSLGDEGYTWELCWHVGREQPWGVITGHESRLQPLPSWQQGGGEEKWGQACSQRRLLTCCCTSLCMCVHVSHWGGTGQCACVWMGLHADGSPRA